mmetsp:Transcript_22626/g.72934  ORF Transcript_22626/g.72934 Transcript_22626/m.72934 type:complete len:214 (+) Transcript_22626:274-915(+)
MYSRSRLEKRSSIALESGLRGGDISGRSRVYFESKLETSRAPSASAGSSGGSRRRSSSIRQLRPRKKACALMAMASDSHTSDSGWTPSRVRGSFVSKPLSSDRVSLASHDGSFGFVCTILRCSSFASLWYHGASPVTISYSNTPSAHRSTAWPHSSIRMISGAMYSVVPMRTGRPDADGCVAGAVSPMAARPKSQSLTLPSAQTSTFSGLRSR